MQQRGLAAARFAQNTVDSALGKSQAEILEYGRIRIALFHMREYDIHGYLQRTTRREIASTSSSSRKLNTMAMIV